MNISASKFSSGCESGWTVYFEQSYASKKSELERDQRHVSYQEEEGEEEEEEEDLSMVSDASSGPPHCHEDDDREECLSSASKYSTKSKQRDERSSKKRNNSKKNIPNCKSDYYYHSCLDDTASSPLSKNKQSTLSNKEAYSQSGFSATQFQGESAFDKHFDMFESSLAKASPSQKPGQFQGGNWE